MTVTNDYDQTQIREPLPHERREAMVNRLSEILERQPFELYQALATPSCGVIDPHHKARRAAAERLARILIPPR